MAAAKERPILMSAPMVRALLAGTQTQTRRVVNDLEPGVSYRGVEPDGSHLFTRGHAYGKVRCPHGQPGDRLRVRESFSGPHMLTGLPPRDWNPGTPIYYWADGREPPNGDWTKPKPGMHMPMWASRITLEISDVRVQRLQEITEDDARAEGITDGGCLNCGNPELCCGCLNPRPDARDAFANLWMSINGPDSWDENPWTWALSFKVVTP